jgi:hypothetical protein
VIQVVLVDAPTGRRANFCTGYSASVNERQGAMADRFSPGTAFRDCKKVVEAGHQHVPSSGRA